MKKKSMKLASLVLAIMMLLTACGGSNKGGSGSNGSDSGKTTAGKDYVLIKNTDLMSMDSAKATDGMSFEVLAAVMEGLYTKDEKGNEVEALVKEAKESEDGKVYTFTLKDAKWSNGEPVTANDFVFAWRRVVDPKTASEYAYIMETAGILNAAAISKGEMPVDKLGVKAVDEKTLEVTLEKRVPFFKKLLSFGSFLPQNEKFVTEMGDQYAQAPDKLIYNGPFNLTEWTAGNSFKAVKSETYYDKDVVKLNSITWKVAKDNQTAALEFDTGSADFVRLSGDVVDKYNGDNRKQTALGGYLWFLVKSSKVKELQNQNLTLAIANAINREELAKVVIKDGAIAANGFVPKDLAVSPSGKDFREESGVFFNEGPEKAKEYAKKAFEELGISSLSLELLFEDSEESKKVAEYLQSNLQKNIPGLTITLKSQPKKSRINLQLAGDFQLSLHRWGPDYPDPMTYLDLYKSGTTMNYDGFNDPEYDKLIDLASSGTQSDEDRWKTMLEAEKLLLSKGLGPIPVYQIGNTTLWSENAKGWIYSSTGVSYYYKFADK